MRWCGGAIVYSPAPTGDSHAVTRSIGPAPSNLRDEMARYFTAFFCCRFSFDQTRITSIRNTDCMSLQRGMQKGATTLPSLERMHSCVCARRLVAPVSSVCNMIAHFIISFGSSFHTCVDENIYDFFWQARFHRQGGSPLGSLSTL